MNILYYRVYELTDENPAVLLILGELLTQWLRHLVPAPPLSPCHDAAEELHKLLVVVEVPALPEVLVPLAAPQVVLVLAHLEPAGLYRAVQSLRKVHFPSPLYE